MNLLTSFFLKKPMLTWQCKHCFFKNRCQCDNVNISLLKKPMLLGFFIEEGFWCPNPFLSCSLISFSHSLTLLLVALQLSFFLCDSHFRSLMQLISSLIEGGTLLPNSKASPWGTSLPLGDSATKFKRKPPIKRLLLRPWDTKLPFLGD